MDWLYYFIPGWDKIFNISASTSKLQTEDITFYFDCIIQGLACLVFIGILYYWIKYALQNIKLLYGIKKCPKNPNKGACPINNIS